ncbi:MULTISPECIES: hypothetical protein [Campylobacter]|uniref:Uncharacterized protein n=1 Tax=Campylobacter vicugnae TaxID=1660076 RepID=A0ABZ2E8T9_9BACT|nr:MULTISPECIES: hypothetical protein [unclassified Campylobacter]ARR03546.1 hypothetical protein CVIC12175_0399 [Campylobacter sp. RM12175]MCR8689550.1 hypothetical protein [Campylobacter sp. RM9264]
MVTANGMAHFAPMMRLEAPQLNIGNPFKDYIAQAIAERELELKEKGLGLDEQKLAYAAADAEAGRDLARELAGQKAKDTKDLLKLEYSHKNNLYNKAKADEDLKQKESNQYYGLLESLADLGTDISNPHNFFTAARTYAEASGLTDVVNFYTNNGTEAAKLNNLFMQNYMNKNVTGDSIKGYSGDGKTKKINFINKN